LLLLGPATPMLFQGQELAASTPFLYFADHEPGLAAQVRRGRLEFLAQFPGLALPELQAGVPEPESRASFERCRLDPGERERESEPERGVHARALALHRDLLRLRREDAVIRRQGDGGLDGAVLGEQA